MSCYTNLASTNCIIEFYRISKEGRITSRRHRLYSIEYFDFKIIQRRMQSTQRAMNALQIAFQ